MQYLGGMGSRKKQDIAVLPKRGSIGSLQVYEGLGEKEGVVLLRER